MGAQSRKYSNETTVKVLFVVVVVLFIVDAIAVTILFTR